METTTGNTFFKATFSNISSFKIQVLLIIVLIKILDIQTQMYQVSRIWLDYVIT